ncbi:MAG: hypothetical protein WCK65_09745 [Rhodospirillaceae bacterium]
MTGLLGWLPEGGTLRTRLLAALSYLGILCFIPLLFSRGDPYVNFHARQGLVIWGWGVLALFSLAVPGFGWFFRISSSLISMLCLIGIVSALLGKSWPFPVVHGLSEKL